MTGNPQLFTILLSYSMVRIKPPGLVHHPPRITLKLANFDNVAMTPVTKPVVDRVVCLNMSAPFPPGSAAWPGHRRRAAHLCGCHDDQTPAILRKLAVSPQINRKVFMWTRWTWTTASVRPTNHSSRGSCRHYRLSRLRGQSESRNHNHARQLQRRSNGVA